MKNESIAVRKRSTKSFSPMNTVIDFARLDVTPPSLVFLNDLNKQ
jgi:hypothetical protein